MPFKKIAAGAIALALLASPAAAQKMFGNSSSGDDEAKKRETDAIDRQYKSTLDRTNKDSTAKNDPWSYMRGNAADPKAKK